MGLPVKGHSLRSGLAEATRLATPAACRQGHWSHSHCCPDVEKNFSSIQRHCLAAGTPSTHCHASRVCLVGDDTVEDVARTPVLAPPDPTNTPLLCSTPLSPLHLTLQPFPLPPPTPHTHLHPPPPPPFLPKSANHFWGDSQWCGLRRWP